MSTICKIIVESAETGEVLEICRDHLDKGGSAEVVSETVKKAGLRFDLLG
jgi:hypothetical protein